MNSESCIPWHKAAKPQHRPRYIAIYNTKIAKIEYIESNNLNSGFRLLQVSRNKHNIPQSKETRSMKSESFSTLEDYIIKRYKPVHRYFSQLTKWEKSRPGIKAVLEAQRLTRKEIYRRRTEKALAK